MPPPQHSKPAVSGNPHRVRGGFFPAVPADDDASMTTSVVHDEDDDSAVQMPRHGRDAMPSHGRVLVLEIVVDPGQPLGPLPPMIDREMLMPCGGTERTAHKCATLIRSAGWSLEQVTPIHGRCCAGVEATPA